MMSRLEAAAAVAPAAPDLSACAQEPIQSPGAIQPHGALLAARAEGRLITHASANLAIILGRSAEAMLGQSLEQAIGDAACRALLPDAVTQGDFVFGPAFPLLAPNGGTLHLRAHRSGRHFCVDIEPVRREAGQGPPVIMLQAILETFKHATRRDELCDLVVRGLKAITGYDRVLAYRFHGDGHGEVIAEARAASMESFLGRHYPASDIPAQARRQFLRQRVGVIADAGYRPVPLLVDPTLDDGAPLDLAHSALRSVSPVHREYMRNMGTAASLTVGLADGPALWGMLVCHHATPRTAAPDLRAVADIVGRNVSLLLDSLGEAEEADQRSERQATMRALVEQLAAPVPLPEALAAGEEHLLHLVNALGAVVRIAGTEHRFGQCPPPASATRAMAVLRAEADAGPLAVDDLGLRHPDLADCTAEGSGALLLPLRHGTDDAILWFRPELRRSVIWGGNPAEHAITGPRAGRLAARTSFAAWKQTITGHSAPWEAVDLTLARELRVAITAEVTKRLGTENIRQARKIEQDGELQLLLAQIFVIVDDAIFISDAKNRIVLANPALETLLGAQPGSLAGTVSLDRFAARYRPAIIAARARQDADGLAYSVDAVAVRDDGTEIDCRVSGVTFQRGKLLRFRVTTVHPLKPGDRVAAPPPIVAAGRIQLIGLGEVRALLGPRWPELKDRAMATAEQVVRSSVGPRDTVSLTDDEGFVICFADATEADASDRAVSIGREVRRRLIGEGASPEAARVFSAATSLPPGARGLPAAEQASLVTRQIEQSRHTMQDAARARLAQLQQATPCVADAVRSRGVAEPVGWLLRLPPATQGAIDAAEAVLPAAQTAGLDADVMLLGGARDFARTAGDGQAGGLVIVTLSPEVMLFSKRMEACVQACRDMEETLRKRLVLLLTLSSGRPAHQLEDALRQLRPFCRLPGVAVEKLEQSRLPMRDLGIGMVLLDAARIRATSGWMDKLKERASILRAQRCRMLVRGATAADAPALFAQGVELVVSREPDRPG